LFKNNTSIGKRIKKEWMQFEGDKIKASPFSKDLRFRRPINLEKKLSAILTFYIRDSDYFPFRSLIMAKTF